MQGRVRVSNSPSEQVRIRKAFCMALMVAVTAEAEANGPKNLPLRERAPRCLTSCGAAWSPVIRM
ncbi:MAG: hypothetical protein H6R00_1326 [Proteobacteria bacterium]|nr:hypothetical protein [Pseudomonadota bacterium]